MESNLLVFLCGVAGGSFAEILKWFQLRESPNWPEYSRSPGYWIITGLMALVGGVLAWVYGLDSTKLLLAINVGISAPLIIKGLAAAQPPATTRDLSAPQPSIANFLAGR